VPLRQGRLARRGERPAGRRAVEVVEVPVPEDMLSVASVASVESIASAVLEDMSCR